MCRFALRENGNSDVRGVRETNCREARSLAPEPSRGGPKAAPFDPSIQPDSRPTIGRPCTDHAARRGACSWSHASVAVLRARKRASRRMSSTGSCDRGTR